MKIKIPEKVADVTAEVDVLVVGGGPAGIGAAVAAARQGSQVMLLEKRGFLGGNITGCYVETCNHFMYKTNFEASGIYHEMEEQYRLRFGRSHDIRVNSAHRFSSEYLKVFLDDFVGNAGVGIKFHSFVNEVVVEDDQIKYVIIQSKKGPLAIKAGIVIDTTGDGDVAFSAGVPFEQGRARDGLCQPGTVNVRIAGVDVDKFKGEPDKLKELNLRFREEYRAGRTGLSCKRQDIPAGRLTSAGIVSYLNYACEYEIDPTSPDGLTQGEIACRRYIMEFYEYLKRNVDGMQNIEIASIAPEIGFRDSRRIQGRYRLTKDDIEADRKFDDAIVRYPRIYDMLAPDGNMKGNGSLEGEGYEGHIYVPIEGDRSYLIPFRCLLPVKISNLMVAGRCLSADHIAESSLRATSACMLTGQAAGTAAGMASMGGIKPAEVNIRGLQDSLKKQGVDLR